MAPMLKSQGLAMEGEPFATNTHPDGSMASDGESLAVECLREAVQCSGLPQKALCGRRSVQQFSKLINGVQSTPLSLLDELPDAVVDDCLARYAQRRGRIYRVPTREEELAQMADDLRRATAQITELTARHLRAQIRESR